MVSHGQTSPLAPVGTLWGLGRRCVWADVSRPRVVQRHRQQQPRRAERSLLDHQLAHGLPRLHKINTSKVNNVRVKPDLRGGGRGNPVVVVASRCHDEAGAEAGAEHKWGLGCSTVGGKRLRVVLGKRGGKGKSKGIRAWVLRDLQIVRHECSNLPHCPPWQFTCLYTIVIGFVLFSRRYASPHPRVNVEHVMYKGVPERANNSSLAVG